MNKEYVKLNDDTFIVSDEKGHMTTQKKVSEKLLNIENKTEVLSNTIDEIDDFIESDKNAISFLKKMFITQPCLFVILSTMLCISVPSPNILVDALISGIIVSPISICLGTKIKSLNKEINELREKREKSDDLLSKYQNEWCEEKNDIYFKTKDKESNEIIPDIKVQKIKIEDIDKELEKPKTLVKKR